MELLLLLLFFGLNVSHHISNIVILLIWILSGKLLSITINMFIMPLSVTLSIFFIKVLFYLFIVTNNSINILMTQHSHISNHQWHQLYIFGMFHNNCQYNYYCCDPNALSTWLLWFNVFSPLFLSWTKFVSYLVFNRFKLLCGINVVCYDNAFKLLLLLSFTPYANWNIIILWYSWFIFTKNMFQLLLALSLLLNICLKCSHYNERVKSSVLHSCWVLAISSQLWSHHHMIIYLLPISSERIGYVCW